jgi:hypothetical protein
MAATVLSMVMPPRWCACPSDFVGRFQHGDLYTGLGEGDRGGQAVRAGPHDDCGTHSSPPARSGPRSFLTRARFLSSSRQRPVIVTCGLLGGRLRPRRVGVRGVP